MSSETNAYMFSFETGVEVAPKPLPQAETPRVELQPRTGPKLNIASGELSRFAQEIKAVQFNPSLDEWIRRYEKCGQRGRFLWQWCAKGVRLTALPCVEPHLRDDVYETKMLSILFGTLIDDIADQEQDREMLEMAMRLGTDEWSKDRLALWTGRRRDYLETIARFWDEVWSRCESYPRFAEFESML